MLTLEGDLTINNMNEIKSEIQKQLNLNASFNIAVSNIKEMDITFLQLLLKLESTANVISLDIAPGDKKKICEFIKNYGYHKELNLLNVRN